MTIAAAYLTTEGVVLGADSTSTVPGQAPGTVVKTLDHAQKVFEIGNGTQFGICVWGAGLLGKYAHRTVAALLGDRLGASPAGGLDFLAAEFGKIVAAAGAPNEAEGGYYIGGIEPVTREPRCSKVAWKGDRVTSVTPLAIGACDFAAAYRYFTRIFWGFDPELPQLLYADLINTLKIDPATVGTALQAAFAVAQPRLISAGPPDLPIREAVDFVHTILHVTIKAFRLKFGPHPCGGPIEIGVITTDRPFRWVRHKRFDSAVTEHSTDHDNLS